MAAGSSVVLIGFMGAGKTTVGRALAARLAAEFTDLDERISAHTGLTVPQIFEYQGEPAFRDLEAQHLAAWLGEPQSLRVLAVGGGAVESADVRSLLAKSGATVLYLAAPLPVLVERCCLQRIDRPLLAHAEERFARREPHYRALGQPVDATAAPDSVAETIARLLEVPA